MWTVILGAVFAGDLETGGLTTIELERDLFEQRDLTLQGVSAVETINFPLPRNWELTADPELHLSFGHSSTLLEDRSTLTVRVNDQGIGSLSLSPTNAVDGQLIVRIPRHMLKDFNTLTFVVDQHYTRDCEDPFDPSLWTRIARTSTIDFYHATAVVTPELKDFPYPFFDHQGYGPLRLTVVHPGPVQDGTAQAAGDLAFALARLADYRGLKMEQPVATTSEAKTAALLIGTADEVPEIRQFLSADDLSGPVVAEFVNLADPTLPILVVSGPDTAAVQVAARTLASNDRYQALAGAKAKVSLQADGVPPPVTHQQPLPAPNVSAFKLSDLGMQDTTVRGFYAPPVTIPILLAGDARANASGGVVTVHYSYSAQLQTGLSSMEVMVNNVSLRSIPLDRPEGEARAALSIEIPAEIWSPYSELKVLFHLYHRDFGSCVRVADRHLWGTVWADSTVELPLDHYAYLPDLSLLRYRYWPVASETADTWIVLPDVPSDADLAAGMQVAANLGQRLTGETWSVHVGSSNAVPTTAKQKIFLLNWSGGHRLYAELEKAGLTTTSGALARRLSAAGSVLLDTQLEESYSTVEAVTMEPDLQVLVLRAPDAAGLLGLAEAMGKPALLQQLAGNLAVVDGAGHVRTLKIAQKILQGNLPPTARGRIFLQGDWLLLGLGVPCAVLLSALVARVVRRKGGTTG